MAKVSLRIYDREIEGLIEQGNTNEAIAHCHHILKTFSKHLGTYRLLGKAYLEAKRYPEAVDVFGRLLMAVPDDFVAHVGLSIINDEDNKLDDAIWHMQRAFETQSSNPAIQAELQRLYGRRDGMEPPKIRMTRGALAQMYMQGELYPQAIAEIRAVLSQEPDRADMQVLLARALFRAGQKADASDMCAQLFKRYLYCFDANRIMVDLLPATADTAESTQVYRMRVSEMEPYANFVKGSVFQVDDVPDASINLERLDYKEEEPQMGQGWGATLGLGTGALSTPMLGSSTSSSSDEQPDWLKSGAFSESPVQTGGLPADESQPAENIPDFMRNAGWGESTGSEQPTSMFDEEPASGDLTPAEIPDWLKGQIPADASQPDSPSPVSAQTVDTPDWLSGLGGTQESQDTPVTPKADVPDWLLAASAMPLPNEEPAQATDSIISGDAAQPANLPDWLGGLGDSKTAESVEPAEIPDWLGGAKSAEPPPPTGSSDVPDWLAGIDDKPSAGTQPGEVTEWLSGLDESKPSEPAPAGAPDWLSGLNSAEPEPIQPADIPDWMAGAESKNQPAPSVENLGASSQEQDDAVAWLESLAAKHGAKPEELVTDPNKRSETPPEWVSQAQTIEQQTPAAQTPAPSVENLGASSQEQDDAVAWLESLAAKHGAKPEELVTDPNKRS
ncbi:MAG: tetratricopeptide repeat protein, partial [Chloroflexi bacterium]|nr:tetratricopeptide repeat protein [Chloroflexota bacterium]